MQFFLLVFALSLPFWLLGAVTDRHLLPGLPLSELAYDPRVTGPILAVADAVVTVVWGPRTLARRRNVLS